MLAGLADTVIDLVLKVAEHNAAGADSGSLLLLGPPGAGQPPASLLQLGMKLLIWMPTVPGGFETATMLVAVPKAIWNWHY